MNKQDSDRCLSAKYLTISVFDAKTHIFCGEIRLPQEFLHWADYNEIHVTVDKDDAMEYGVYAFGFCTICQARLFEIIPVQYCEVCNAS